MKFTEQNHCSKSTVQIKTGYLQESLTVTDFLLEVRGSNLSQRPYWSCS
jgi:hypothetical protein